MKVRLILMALFMSCLLGASLAGAEEMNYVDVGSEAVSLNGDFSARITIRHTPGQRVEGGIRFYVQDRDYYAFLIRWEQDIRCDFYGAKYEDGMFKGFLIAEEYEEIHKDCFVSVDDAWDASYDSAMTLCVSVRDGVAMVTMTGADTGYSGTLHFDLSRSPWLDGKYAERDPLTWSEGALKSAVARAQMASFQVDEYTMRGQPVQWPLETEEAEKSVSDYFTPGKFRDSVGTTIPYQLHVPENMEKEKVYPLILYMHGIGHNGMDNRQPIEGMEFVICNRILESGMECLILAPQSPVGWLREDGLDISLRKNSLFEQRQPSKYLNCALELLEDIIYRYPVDTSRLYYYGYSMGAIAGYHVLGDHPGLFAGAILCAGVGFPDRVEEIAQTPLYVYHGTVDDIVSYQDDKELCDLITKAGGTVVFKSCPGYAHSLSAAMRVDPNVILWLLEQALK